MTSRTSASSTSPEKPLAVRRSPRRDLIMRTTSAVFVSLALMACVSVSLSCCSSAMNPPCELLYPQTRVQHVTKAVAQEIQAQARERQRQPGEEAHPERFADHVLAAGDHVAP